MAARAEVGYGRSQAAGEFSSLRQDASDDAVHSMVACLSNATRVKSGVLAAGVAGGGPPAHHCAVIGDRLAARSGCKRDS